MIRLYIITVDFWTYAIYLINCNYKLVRPLEGPMQAIYWELIKYFHVSTLDTMYSKISKKSKVILSV